MTTKRRTFRPRTGNLRGLLLRLRFARQSHGVLTPGQHSLGSDWTTLYLWENNAATSVVQ